MLGRDGEPLAMDVARFGPQDSRAVLILSSACHGVEGFCGSGGQVALIAAELHATAERHGVGLLYIHGLNPYGFSWWRRVTHENVDLNRNFVDFAASMPVNSAYEEIASLLVPDNWPPSPAVSEGLERYVAERGLKAFQAAVSAGQYTHPTGLFFGGQSPTWSNLTLRRVLREHCGLCERLGWIDFHTGLGASGHCERIFCGNYHTNQLQRARSWWGNGITSVDDGTSASARLSGLMWMSVPAECPKTEYTGIALEYGTVEVLKVVEALRAEQWLQLHTDASATQAMAIKRQMRDAFYTDTLQWKIGVVAQAREAALQALTGLSGR